MNEKLDDTPRGRSITRAASRDFCLDLQAGLPIPTRRRRGTVTSSHRGSSLSSSRIRSLGEPNQQGTPPSSLEWDTLEENTRLHEPRLLYGVEVGTADDVRSIERVLNPRGYSDSDDEVFGTPDSSFDGRLVVRREPLGGQPSATDNKRKKTSELDKQLLNPSPAVKSRRLDSMSTGEPGERQRTTGTYDAPFSPTSPGSTTIVDTSTPRPSTSGFEAVIEYDGSFDRELQCASAKMAGHIEKGV